MPRTPGGGYIKTAVNRYLAACTSCHEPPVGATSKPFDGRCYLALYDAVRVCPAFKSLTLHEQIAVERFGMVPPTVPGVV